MHGARFQVPFVEPAATAHAPHALCFSSKPLGAPSPLGSTWEDTDQGRSQSPVQTNVSPEWNILILL